MGARLPDSFLGLTSLLASEKGHGWQCLWWPPSLRDWGVIYCTYALPTPPGPQTPQSASGYFQCPVQSLQGRKRQEGRQLDLGQREGTLPPTRPPNRPRLWRKPSDFYRREKREQQLPGGTGSAPLNSPVTQHWAWSWQCLGCQGGPRD